MDSLDIIFSSYWEAPGFIAPPSHLSIFESVSLHPMLCSPLGLPGMALSMSSLLVFSLSCPPTVFPSEEIQCLCGERDLYGNIESAALTPPIAPSQTCLTKRGHPRHTQEPLWGERVNGRWMPMLVGWSSKTGHRVEESGRSRAANQARGSGRNTNASATSSECISCNFCVLAPSGFQDSGSWPPFLLFRHN